MEIPDKVASWRWDRFRSARIRASFDRIVDRSGYAAPSAETSPGPGRFPSWSLCRMGVAEVACHRHTRTLVRSLRSNLLLTSQGHVHAQFQRALKTGNAVLALDLARDLRRVTLEDALGLCLVLRRDEQRYQRATARWLARYQAEADAVTLTDIREIADLLAALPVFGADAAAELANHLELHSLYRCASRVRDIAMK